MARRGERVSKGRGAAAALLAAALAAAPAAAEPPRSGLPVAATVLPVCTASTAPLKAGESTAAAVACSNGGRWTVSLAVGEAPARRRAAPAPDRAASRSGVRFVTVSY